MQLVHYYTTVVQYYNTGYFIILSLNALMQRSAGFFGGDVWKKMFNLQTIIFLFWKQSGLIMTELQNNFLVL